MAVAEFQGRSYGFFHTTHQHALFLRKQSIIFRHPIRKQVFRNDILPPIVKQVKCFFRSLPHDLVIDRRDLKASIARALRFMRAVPAPAPEPTPALAGVSGESTS